ncbi:MULTISPECIES: ferrochelatase [Nocardia]|uniref:ferrochelatase n=1 Tax=Nocardia TaxID=1817 RepID=UPI000BF0F53C|nr:MULTISPECIES: ferrochelatase [Nocardia]MBF6068558.1 ferrochelatase [Nocardia farcinica]MBF6185937.1 ferrochelatase [Nocardia farcinica]MBF6250287.1 ferrochelatase [Nocardia farcinica]MBF6256517.1 ferrochelatase [Nocardia farcinica]MBF6311782.1 ferrochelatase [Nocardia farcinica]
MAVEALLLLSFGGPERPEDVMPFLENVTRGRGVPRARLEEVAQHYLHFGGVSPINALNRDIIAGVERELDEAGIDLPVYFGNRNWHPMVEDTVAEMARDGVTGALVFPTSAWGGYSGCRQYHEDIERARAAVGPAAPHLTKLRQYFDHPLLIEAFADAIRAALERLPADRRDRARLVFTAHSVPVAADAAAGPPADGGELYSRQVADAARLCAAATGFADHDLVWQSRSGPPQVPWLEPDIVDHLEDLAGRGVDAVVVCPVGFVSDHLEVIWDLDNEAKDKAAELGMAFARASTPGTDPRFPRLVVELMREHLDGLAPRRLGAEPGYGCTTDGVPCASGCCAPQRRPAAAGR